MNAESILVVDDNFDNVELTKIVLEYEGWEVRTAGDAEETLNILRTYRPRLILMDVQLPGMDGLELTRRLRQQPPLRDTIIVALTAYAMKGDQDAAQAAGCNGYIAKPIDTRTFPAMIRGYLEGGSTGFLGIEGGGGET